MNGKLRQTFDECFERVLTRLPDRIISLIEEDVVVIVDDEPTRAMLDDLAAETGEELHPDSLLGLHTGVPITDWSIEDHGRVPPTVHLFRRGLLADATGDAGLDARELERQIRITLLHEIGHHFGLEEGDLEDLGFG